MYNKFESYGKKISFKKNTYICQEGFEINNVYLLLSGICKITTQSESGNILSFGFYKDNGIIGDLETFSNYNIAKTSVISVTDINCIKIPLNISRNLVLNNIEYSNLLARTLADKLMSSSIKTTQNILLPLEDRLLLYLKNTYPNKIFNGNLTQISQELGTSYRHLLRVLKKFKESKVLVPSIKKNEYIINI